MQAILDFIKNIITILAALFGKKPGPPNPPPPPPPPTDFSQDEMQLLVAHNIDRHKSSVSDLTINLALTKAARTQAAYMASISKLTHLGPNSTTPTLRAKNEGYKPVAIGENLQSLDVGKTLGDAMNNWMNSSPHRRNMLNGGYRDVGFGIAKSSGGVTYLVADFGVEGSGTSTEYCSGWLNG